MEFWYTEEHTPNVRFSIRVDRQLYSGQSEFQRIDVFESPEFGRFLTLDGYMMLTEKDEFIYHEMITHVPMCVHPEAENILVIGGGDGGTVRELLRYPTVRHIDLVEIDEMVIDVCRESTVKTGCALCDDRSMSTISLLWIRRILLGQERDCSPKSFMATASRPSKLTAS